MHLIDQWNCVGLHYRAKLFWSYLFHGVIWGICKERNLRIFEGKKREAEDVIESIIREVGGWLFVSNEYKGLSLSMFMKDWVIAISSSHSWGRNVSGLWIRLVMDA